MRLNWFAPLPDPIKAPTRDYYESCFGEGEAWSKKPGEEPRPENDAARRRAEKESVMVEEIDDQSIIRKLRGIKKTVRDVGDAVQTLEKAVGRRPEPKPCVCKVTKHGDLIQAQSFFMGTEWAWCCTKCKKPLNQTPPRISEEPPTIHHYRCRGGHLSRQCPIGCNCWCHD